MNLAVGKLRGNKLQDHEGTWICVWYPFPGDEDAGLCFDLAADDVNDMISLLTQLRDSPADLLPMAEEDAKEDAQLDFLGAMFPTTKGG